MTFTVEDVVDRLADAGVPPDVADRLSQAAAVGMWWLFRKSKLGFELRTVGANPNAAKIPSAA